MTIDRNKRVHRVRGAIGIGAMALLLGAWILPAGTASGATAFSESEALSVSINVPLNEIEDGQYCVAYGQASGGSGSLTFDWGGQGGQFFNTHASDGPQGTRQIAGTNVYSGAYASLRVIDQVPDTATDLVYLDVSSSYDYNEDCEG